MVHKQIIYIFLYYKHLKWNNHPGHTVIALKETSIANLISIIYKNSYQAKYYPKSSCKQKSIIFQLWLGFNFYSVILFIRTIMPKLFEFGTYCSGYGQTFFHSINYKSRFFLEIVKENQHCFPQISDSSSVCLVHTITLASGDKANNNSNPHDLGN